MKAPWEWSLWQLHLVSSNMPSIKALNIVDTQIVVVQKAEWNNYFLVASEL